MSHAENPGESPVPYRREVLTRRPSQRPPAPPLPEQPARWSRVRTALSAFTAQVLLRPARIGTLALLGGMIGAMVVGAEGWWIVLGITLFQVAACALIVVWVDTRVVRSLPRDVQRRRLRCPRVERRQVERFWESHPTEGGCPDHPGSVLVRVPQPRQPRPDE